MPNQPPHPPLTPYGASTPYGPTLPERPGEFLNFVQAREMSLEKLQTD